MLFFFSKIKATLYLLKKRTKKCEEGSKCENAKQTRVQLSESSHAQTPNHHQFLCALADGKFYGSLKLISKSITQISYNLTANQKTRDDEQAQTKKYPILMKRRSTGHRLSGL